MKIKNALETLQKIRENNGQLDCRDCPSFVENEDGVDCMDNGRCGSVLMYLFDIIIGDQQKQIDDLENKLAITCKFVSSFGEEKTCDTCLAGDGSRCGECELSCWFDQYLRDPALDIAKEFAAEYDDGKCIENLVSRYKQHAIKNEIDIGEMLKDVEVPASLEIDPRPVSESDIEEITRDEKTFCVDIWEGRGRNDE